MKISKAGKRLDGTGDFVLTRMYYGAALFISDDTMELEISNLHLQGISSLRTKFSASWAALKFIWNTKRSELPIFVDCWFSSGQDAYLSGKWLAQERQK